MRLLLAARVSRRRIEATERDTPFRPGETERAYQITGQKLRTGSFYSSSWTEEQVITRALTTAREHNPKARVYVSWCAVCRKGSAPGIACAHEDRINHKG